MTTIRLLLGLLCIIHPLVPGVGVSLTTCVLGLGLIVSTVLQKIDSDDAYDLELSK